MERHTDRIVREIYKIYRETGRWPTRMYLGHREVGQMMAETGHQATVVLSEEEFKGERRRRTFMDVEWFPVSEENHFFII